MHSQFTASEVQGFTVTLLINGGELYPLWVTSLSELIFLLSSILVPRHVKMLIPQQMYSPRSLVLGLQFIKARVGL